MLHALALQMSAMEKLALPSKEEDARIRKALEEKQKELLENRGISAKKKKVPVFDSAGNQTGTKWVDDWDKTRTSKSSKRKTVTTQYEHPETGKKKKTTHTVPGKSRNTAKSPLTERAYVQPQLSDKTILKHRTIVPLKQFWAGHKGFGKWPNRLLLGGGTALAGLGILRFLSKEKEREQAQSLQNALSVEDYSYGYPALSAEKYSAAVGQKYVQDAANIPKPASAASVSMPPPGKASGGSGGGLLAGKDFPSTASEKNSADATWPLLAALAGGVGGTAIGGKIRDVWVQSAVQSGRHFPLIAGTAGALIMGALTLAMMKRQQKEPAGYYSHIPMYDPTRAGYFPSENTRLIGPANNPYRGPFYG